MAIADRIIITHSETTNSTMLKPAMPVRGVPERFALLAKANFLAGTGP
jgi:hypothetical protein